MEKVERWLVRQARWPLILALALGSVFIMGVLFPLWLPTQGPAAGAALDVRFGGYTVAEVQALLGAMTPAQRHAAAWGHLTLDGLYPAVYGLLLALLLARAWPGRRFWLLAPAAVLADLGENALLAAMFWGYPGRLGLTPFASALTTLKWGLVGGMALLLLLGFAWRGWAAFKGRSRRAK